MESIESLIQNGPMNKPLVISVVTCTYNSEKFLEQALRSVETQSYPYIEHILNDSYSTDRTLNIIQAYMDRNQDRYPIKLIQTEPQGVANALNNATGAATGDIIHYLHSDDYYGDPEALARVAAHFANDTDLVWLTGNFYLEIRGQVITIPHTYLLKTNPAAAISVMNIVHHENTFMKRDAVAAYGSFCEDKTMNVEYRLWLRLIQDHDPLVVNDQFTVFIIHDGSTSTGNILQFSKAILRGFNTLQREKVFPFIGYYEDRELYQNYKAIFSGVQELVAALVSWDVLGEIYRMDLDGLLDSYAMIRLSDLSSWLSSAGVKNFEAIRKAITDRLPIRQEHSSPD